MDKLQRLKVQFQVTGIPHTVRALASGAQAVGIDCPFADDDPTHDKAEIYVSAGGVESFHCDHCPGRSVSDVMRRLGLTWWQDTKSIEPLASFAEFRNQFKSDVRRPIVQGWLSERDIANVVSGSKGKKSLWVSQLILSICAGIPFLNLFPTHYRGPILLLDYELHADTLIDRITRQCAAL